MKSFFEAASSQTLREPSFYSGRERAILWEFRRGVATATQNGGRGAAAKLGRDGVSHDQAAAATCAQCTHLNNRPM